MHQVPREVGWEPSRLGYRKRSPRCVGPRWPALGGVEALISSRNVVSLTSNGRAFPQGWEVLVLLRSPIDWQRVYERLGPRILCSGASWRLALPLAWVACMDGVPPRPSHDDGLPMCLTSHLTWGRPPGCGKFPASFGTGGGQGLSAAVGCARASSSCPTPPLLPPACCLALLSLWRSMWTTRPS